MTTTRLLKIQVPFPDVGSPELHLELASCRLDLHSGEPQPWVSGTYDDLTGSLPLSIEPDGPVLTLKQRETLAETLRLESRLAPLHLALGNAHPFSLILGGGLLDTRADLSGLPITRLELKPGKGNQRVTFDAPNPQLMQEMKIRMGEARLEMRGLGNANFTSLNVECGKADCLFDFAGELRRQAHAKITVPQGSVELHVPASTPTHLSVETFGALDVDDGFRRKKGAIWNAAALAGQAPLLIVHATVLTGSIQLRAC